MNVEEKWLKIGGAITQTWIVLDPISQCHRYYCATGESGPGRLADLIEQAVSQYGMYKCRIEGTALAKPVERAVRKKLVECSKGDAPMPNKEQWKEFLAPESPMLCIEYSCRHCGAMCRVYNKYGQQMDTHERYGRATCALLGRQCFSGDMAVAGSLIGGRNLPPTTYLPGDGEAPTSANGSGIPLSHAMSRMGGATGFHPFATSAAQEELHPEFAWESSDPPGSPFNQPIYPELHLPPSMPHVSPGPAASSVPPVYSIATPHGFSRSRSAPTDPGMAEILKAITQLTKEVGDLKNKKAGEKAGVKTSPFSFSLRRQGENESEAGEEGEELEDDDEVWGESHEDPAVHKVAKSMGKSVGCRDYNGDAQTAVFKAWCETMKNYMRVHQVKPGPGQITVASWNLKGRALAWWENLLSTQKYKKMRTLDDLFTALRKQFRPDDASEQAIAHWSNLRQTRDVTSYMDEVDKLHLSHPLCEVAEFGLARAGLRREIRGIIRRALADQDREWLTLKELRDLARSAEIEKCDPVFIRSEKKTTHHVHAMQGEDVGGNARAKWTKPNNTPHTSNDKRCGVCNLQGHWTRTYKQKKEKGCWRCGGNHRIAECTAPFARTGWRSTTTPQGTPKKEENTPHQQYLSVVRVPPSTSSKVASVLSLTYPVRVKGTGKVVLATVDTGAQCSAIRADVFRQIVQNTRIKMREVEAATSPLVKGVSGEPLKILGAATIQFYANGVHTIVQPWVIEGMDPQLILGLPWIMKEKPVIEWETGTLVFPSKAQWAVAGEMQEPTSQLSRTWEKIFLMMSNTTHVNAPPPQTPVLRDIEGSCGEEGTVTIPVMPDWVAGLVAKHEQLFAPLEGIPPDGRIKHAIELVEGAKPVMKRPYRLSEVQRQHANEQIRKALSEGWIQPSQSAWGTAILMVPKKDGTWRMCVDYRELNSLTVQDAYPMLRIDDLLYKLGGAKYFSKLDLQAGYHQIWMEPQDRSKTAFRIAEPIDGHCLFEWKVMPFGLKNAPPTFQRYMTLVMAECAACCLVYMDDLLVYSSTPEQHLCDLARVFSTLHQAKLRVKKEKCVFGATSVEFLGHVISGGRIEMEPNKKDAILKWKSPSQPPNKFVSSSGLYPITAASSPVCQRSPNL